MTDPTAPEADGDTGPRWALIIVSVLVVVGAAIAAFALFGSDDDDASTTTGTTTAPTSTPSTTAASEPTTAPTTVSPTSAPPTSAAPTTIPTTTAPSGLEFTIEDIDDGDTIPVEFTCDGDNTPPLVTVESSPEGTLELAFIVDDPDAPTDEPFVHWVVYGIPGATTEFTDAEDGLTYGVNDADVEGWIGPCPPPGDGAHEYVFTLVALDEELGLEPGLDGRELADAVVDATVADAEIRASYERAG